MQTTVVTSLEAYSKQNNPNSKIYHAGRRIIGYKWLENNPEYFLVWFKNEKNPIQLEGRILISKITEEE